MTDDRRLTVGFPRMYNEPGERRAFLPPLMAMLASLDVDAYVEAGSGTGMGYPDDAYAAVSPRVHIVDEATAYAQDIVLVLRAPEGRYELIRRGAILLSMLHFTTRPERVELLRSLGIEAIALDMITGDDGRRLVQNLRDVARNGLAAAFDALERRWPPLLSPARPAVSVTVLGAGGVGKHAIEWAAKAGDEARNARFMEQGLPGRRGGRRGAEPRRERCVLPAPARPDRHPRGRDGAPRHVAPAVPQRMARLAAGPRGRVRPRGRSRTCSTTTRRSCAASRASRRATSTSGSSAPTTRPGTGCRPGSRPPSDGPSSPATRGRASGPRRAWRPTGRR